MNVQSSIKSLLKRSTSLTRLVWKEPSQPKMRARLNDDNVAIQVEGLTKRYGDLNAVNGISFTVNKGEIFAFLGPNGAGKTTTVEILEGLRKPTSGSARVLGYEISRDGESIKKSIGVLPQGFSSGSEVRPICAPPAWKK